MKKIMSLGLMCILVVTLAACGIAVENTGVEHTATYEDTNVANQSATAENTITDYAIVETVITEPTATEPVPVETLEITEEMLLLAHHCPEIEKHCDRWECERGCENHCDEHCILHVPDHVGCTVNCPSGKLWCIGQASSEEREMLQNLPLDQGYWIEVDPTTEFEVTGIRYVCDTNGTPDPNRESDIPATTYEMGWWGAAVPISSDRMGVVYLIDPNTVQELSLEESLELGPQDGPPEGFLAVIPYYIQVTGEK